MDPIQPQFPPPKQPDPSDPEWRAKAAKGAVKVAEITATLAVVARVVPGVPGKIVAFLLAGVEKDPGTGKVRPGRGTIGNFAPAPIGFMPAEVYGLKPNFWIPSGATNYLPGFADRLGLGIPQQRAEDQAEKMRQAQLRAAQASVIVSVETLETVQNLAEGTGGLFSRASEIRSTSGIGFAELQSAARAELLIRQNTLGFVAQLSQVVEQLAASSGVKPKALAPIGAAAGLVLSASIQPEAIHPVNDAAKRNEDNARGIAAALVQDRADP